MLRKFDEVERTVCPKAGSSVSKSSGLVAENSAALRGEFDLVTRQRQTPNFLSTHVKAREWAEVARTNARVHSSNEQAFSTAISLLADEYLVPAVDFVQCEAANGTDACRTGGCFNMRVTVWCLRHTCRTARPRYKATLRLYSATC